MTNLEKELPMAFVFYGQDTLVEHNKRYDEIGIFYRTLIFWNIWRTILKKPRRVIYAAKIILHQHLPLLMLISWKKPYGNSMAWLCGCWQPCYHQSDWIDWESSVIGRVGLIMLSCGTGAWRVRTSMNRLSRELGVTCTVDVGLMSISFNCLTAKTAFHSLSASPIPVQYI